MNEDWIQPNLIERRKQGLERHARPLAAGPCLNFAGNDYLNLARNPQVIDRARAALETDGAGSTASRLVTGTFPIHEELEQRLAQKKGYPAALVFGSGFLTNAGVIPVLAGRGDLIFADKLVHASMIDACKLSGAKLVRFAHNDCASLQQRLEQTASSTARRLIITESVFSMDGDIAPLKGIAALAEQFGAMLMVDEAHSTGIFGKNGAGLVSELNLQNSVNISMGTISKALGGYGGFIACSTQMRQLLIQSSRAFIYTTAPPPAVIGAALGSLDQLDADPTLGATLLKNAAFFRKRLQAGGLDTLQSESQIVPVLIGDNERTVAIAQALKVQGIIVAAIRPPTVPSGTARLRLSVSLAHSKDDLIRAADAIIHTVQTQQS